jgi:hypothetical protein
MELMGFNEFTNLNEGRLVTHVFDIMRQMKKIDGIEDTIELMNTGTGMIGLFRHSDGNAYEVEIRPASLARHRETDMFGKLMKKKGKRVKGTDIRYKDIPNWWKEKKEDSDEEV